MPTLLPGPDLGLPPARILGFPPVRYEGWGRGTPTPFRKVGDTRRRHRVGVETTEISPDPQKTTPPDTRALHHTYHPLAYANTVLQPSLSSHHGPRREAGRTERKELRRGTTV